MKKSVKEKTLVEVEKTLDIICNKCGETCSNQKRKNQEHFEYSGLVETEVHGGYDSEVIGDMRSWKFSLCEFCLEKLVKTFKIPFQVKDQGLSRDYMSQDDLDNLVKKRDSEVRDSYIQKILEKDKNQKKEDLETKSNQELYSIIRGLK